MRSSSKSGSKRGGGTRTGARRAKPPKLRITTIQTISFPRKQRGLPKTMEICFRDEKTGELIVQRYRVGVDQGKDGE